MEDFLRLIGVPDSAMKTVQVEPMPVEYKPFMKRVRMKACYNNSFNFLANYPDSKYCVGYALGVIPIEHAWIRVGEKYFDPTWEKYSTLGEKYISLVELDNRELYDIVCSNRSIPPSLYDLSRLKKLPWTPNRC